MSQFEEPKSKKGKCPICGNSMVIRSTRGGDKTCGRQTCKSMKRYATRYKGTNAGPMDRPKNIADKTKLPS